MRSIINLPESALDESVLRRRWGGERTNHFGRPTERTFGWQSQSLCNEDLVPEVVTQETVEEPTWLNARGFERLLINEIIVIDFFHEGIKWSSRSKPLKNWLTESQLLAKRDFRWNIASQSALQEQLRPAKWKAIRR
jgi:hypothetical protein